MHSVPTTATGRGTERTLLDKAFQLSGGLLVEAVPPPPLNLDEEGGRWWNYYCQVFVDGKILSRLFLTSIHNLCIAHMLRNNIMLELSDGIMIDQYIVNKDKEVQIISKLNPLVKDLRNVIIEMDRLLASLGMTAYTSKVNNFDTSGMVAKIKAGGGPPTTSLPLPRNSP